MTESALQENIRTKGKNSYYYAHKANAAENAVNWNGSIAPRLLSSSRIDDKAIVKTAIKKYGWGDGKCIVSIYIPVEAEIPEEALQLNWESDSIEFEMSMDDGKVCNLKLELYEAIESASYKMKKDKIVITLRKEKEMSWHQLKK